MMSERVLYKGREAVLSKYFDSDCLKFKKSDGRPPFEEKDIFEYPDIPEEYVVYLWSLSIKDRKAIQYLDEEEQKVCFCNRLGRGDSPKMMAKESIIEILGEDPLEYDRGDFADSKKFVQVKCTSCGKIYRINIASGYRTSYFNWVEATCSNPSNS